MVRALGFGSDSTIMEIFGESESLQATIEKIFIKTQEILVQKKLLKMFMKDYVQVNQKQLKVQETY